MKFENSFYGDEGVNTDRYEMRMDRLEIENREWIERNLEVVEFSSLERGLIKWTIEDEGKYEFHLESRSTTYFFSDNGEGMGVNIKLKMNLKQVKL